MKSVDFSTGRSMSDHSASAHSAGSRSRRKLKLNLGKKAQTFPQIESITHLPDDVVIDILIRLPAKDVFRSRCVCRNWRILTSTRDFTDSHLRRSFPMILKNCFTRRSEDYNGPNLLDGCWETGRTRSKIHQLNQPYGDIYLSHNGLIVARARARVRVAPNLLIYNPIYSHVVNINVGSYRGDLCGFFFHPLLQEYCTLWETIQSFEPWKVQYKILNLESNPKWRDIENPCTPNQRISKICPVLIDDHLYWLAEPYQNYSRLVKCDIVEYDIGKEEFRVIPCPAPVGLKLTAYYNVNLVDIDGDVSVVQVIPYEGEDKTEINIWTLKDDGEQLWTSSNYIIIINSVTKFGVPKAIAFRNGELVLLAQRRLYVCNLSLGTFRKFGQNYGPNDEFLSHVTSLASLKNCRTNICIAAEEDETESNHDEEVSL